MRRAPFLYSILAAGLLTACDNPHGLSGGSGFLGASQDAGRDDGLNGVRVLSWNLYVGADVDAVIGALLSPDPTDDVPALLQAVATLGETDFPSRAAAIADHIQRARPHAVGLQEVSLIDIDLTALGAPVVVHLDFLEILSAELALRGLGYDVAAIVPNVDAQPAPGIRLRDFDALLVDRDRVTVTATTARNFATNVGPIAPGVALVRGFVGVTAIVAGRTVAIFNTHLEPDLGGADLSGLRAAQMQELVAAIGAAPHAVIMGDLNDEPGSLMYQVLAAAGFTDVWAALRPGADGLTCCHLSDLSNTLTAFDQRIDYVFSRGLAHPRAGELGRIERLGEVPADRLAGPQHAIWPSDHAGLMAELR